MSSEIRSARENNNYKLQELNKDFEAKKRELKERNKRDLQRIKNDHRNDPVFEALQKV